MRSLGFWCVVVFLLIFVVGLATFDPLQVGKHIQRFHERMEAATR